MDLIITLKKGTETKTEPYKVPESVKKVWLHVNEIFNKNGWTVEAADEKSYYEATKGKSNI